MPIVGNLQQLGRAVMLPMIILPAAAVFQSMAQLPWHLIGLPQMMNYLLIASAAIFQFLPYIFALGIALGLTSNGLGAGIAALVGMFIYSGITSHYAPETEPTVLIGTFIGIVAGVSHLRFKNLRLPEYIQFFGGPRF